MSISSWTRPLGKISLLAGLIKYLKFRLKSLIQIQAWLPHLNLLYFILTFVHHNSGRYNPWTSITSLFSRFF